MLGTKVLGPEAIQKQIIYLLLENPSHTMCVLGYLIAFAVLAHL
jgi:hypothetical protein